MSPVLVDTSVWIEALRRQGNAEIREHVRSLLLEGQACWNELILVELWNGAQGNAEKKMIRELETDIPLLSITSAVWQQTCKLAEKARDQGKTVPTTDIIIFACCKYHKVELFHNDQHFDLLMQLTL